MSHAFRERVVASMRRAWGSFGASAGLGADACYTPVQGAPVFLRVLPVMADAVIEDPFAGRTRQTGRTFLLMTADAATRPAKGDTIARLDGDGIAVETFTLTEPAISDDSLRLVWRCVTGEPS